MKIKFTALICILAMLLTGCGAAVEETTATEIVETTIPTEETIEPTEEQTFFEEMGLTMWEGFEVSSEVTEDGEKRTIGSCKLPYGSEVVFSRFEDFRELMSLNVAATEINVEVTEKKVDQIDTDSSEFSDRLEQFYQANLSNNPNLTKELWLSQYADYKIIEFDYTILTDVSSEVEKYFENHSGYNWWNSFYYSPEIMDMNTGHGYSACFNYNDVGEFELENDTANRKFFMIIDGSEEWVDVDDSKFRDRLVTRKVYILIPEEYDGMTLVIISCVHHRTMEEFEEYYAKKNEDKNEADCDESWSEYEYSDLVEDSKRYKLFFVGNQ